MEALIVACITCFVCILMVLDAWNRRRKWDKLLNGLPDGALKKDSSIVCKAGPLLTDGINLDEVGEV